MEREPSIGEIKDRIRERVLKHVQGEPSANLRDHTPLQSSGILNSFAVLDLITFLEQQFGIELSASETGVEGFDRIQEMATLVAGKRIS